MIDSSSGDSSSSSSCCRNSSSCSVMCLLSHRCVRVRVMGEEVELVQRAGMAVSHQKIKYCFDLYTPSVLCITNANVC